MRIIGAFDADSLVAIPDQLDWPAVSVERRESAETPAASSLRDDRAELEMSDGSWAIVDRARARATLLSPEPRDDDDLVHPFLGAAGAAYAWWTGGETLHAGAFEHGGRAWGVLGPYSAGKTTALAGLSARGRPILADDTLVLRDATAMAGPRTLDLRPDAHARFDGVLPARPVRRGAKLRAALPAAQPETPLGGFLVLAWGDRLTARALPPRERVERLAAQRAIDLAPPDPGALLRLAELPCWELQRPRDWAAFDASLDLALELTSP